MTSRIILIHLTKNHITIILLYKLSYSNCGLQNYIDFLSSPLICKNYYTIFIDLSKAFEILLELKLNLKTPSIAMGLGRPPKTNYITERKQYLELNGFKSKEDFYK